MWKISYIEVKYVENLRCGKLTIYLGKICEKCPELVTGMAKLSTPASPKGTLVPLPIVDSTLSDIDTKITEHSQFPTPEA